MCPTYNPRKRFLDAMYFRTTDRIPTLHFEPWLETTQRWKLEGMSDYEQEIKLFDGPMQSCWLYKEYHGPIPKIEEKVLSQDDKYIRVRNQLGQVELRLKYGTSMPLHEEYPIKSRLDWQNYRKRLDPYSIGRYPDDWTDLVNKRKTIASKEIRGVAVWGFYGFPREMLGIERLSLMFYDEPNLISEMNEYWLDFTIKRLEKGVTEMDFDYALIWEDNCGKQGMLHSPDIFKKFMRPYYKKLIDFFNKHDINIISVDSDGNVSELIPLLLDVGVTAIHPFEVAAGADVVEIGKQFPELQMWGGIDKRVLAKGRKAIDDELNRVLPAMKERKGYAAGLDHLVPSDVSLENFRYFTNKLFEMSLI